MSRIWFSSEKRFSKSPWQLVGLAAAGLPEVLELVLEQLLAGAPVENEEDDVEEEPGLLDVDLPVVGPPVDRRGVLLGLVARAVLDLEFEASGHDDLGRRLGADGGPELLCLREIPEVLGRQLDLRRRLDDLELRLLLELLLQEAVKLALDVDALEALVARLVRVGDENEGRERDPLVAAQRQLRLEGQAQPHLVDTRKEGDRAEKRRQEGARPRMRPLRRTGGLSGRLRVRGVELRETRVVAADVVVVRVQLQRLLVLGERPREIPVGLQSDREVVVGPGVAGLPARSPARSGRPPRATAPSWRPRSRRRVGSTRAPGESTRCSPPRQ